MIFVLQLNWVSDSPGMKLQLGGASAALAALLADELGVGGVLDVVVRQQLLLGVELHVAGVATELKWYWRESH